MTFVDLLGGTEYLPVPDCSVLSLVPRHVSARCALRCAAERLHCDWTWCERYVVASDAVTGPSQLAVRSAANWLAWDIMRRHRKTQDLCFSASDNSMSKCCQSSMYPCGTLLHPTHLPRHHTQLTASPVLRLLHSSDHGTGTLDASPTSPAPSLLKRASHHLLAAKAGLVGSLLSQELRDANPHQHRL